MTRKIEDYSNPQDAVMEFEQSLSSFTGAPYVVATDSCTHALELCLRLNKRHIINPVNIPAKTYLSVPMTLHKLDIPYKIIDEAWSSEYQLTNTHIWDSARRLDHNMYRKGMAQCLSFGHSKPMEIGHGGAILLDNSEDYRLLKMMSYDGRDVSYTKWEDQKTFSVGYHYMMRPEDAVKGINILQSKCFNYTHASYPDIRRIKIV